MTSLAHHVIAAAASFYAMYAYWDDVYTTLGRNDKFPVAQLVQAFNVGYFLYDICHALTWEHQFIVHHLTALAGFLSSESASSETRADRIRRKLQSGSRIL